MNKVYDLVSFAPRLSRAGNEIITIIDHQYGAGTLMMMIITSSCSTNDRPTSPTGMSNDIGQATLQAPTDILESNSTRFDMNRPTPASTNRNNLAFLRGYFIRIRPDAHI
jgi:hypothetical protein